MNERQRPDGLQPILAELDDAYRHLDGALAALRDLRGALLELRRCLSQQDEAGDSPSPDVSPAEDLGQADL